MSLSRIDTPLLLAVQRRTPERALGVARGLSLLGEHAAAWIVLGALGAARDGDRRGEWLQATGAVVLAHGVSVVLKRVARRSRPDVPGLRIGVGVPSRWSFPSSHATSTAAAAVVYGRLLGSAAPAAVVPVLAVVPVMAWSRVALGVHFPSDVAAGSVLGGAVALLARPRRP